jgi:MarR family transcriptional regulator, temperature-dependent positive regulator of motility
MISILVNRMLIMRMLVLSRRSCKGWRGLKVHQGEVIMAVAPFAKTVPDTDLSAALPISGMPGHLIRRLHQASVAIFDNEIRQAGFDLTPVQFAALTMIEARPGLDQATLALGIAYDRVTLGGVVDRLEQKGYVRREIAAQDRRARQVFLLPAGEAVLAGVRPIVERVQAHILAGLSADENEALCRLMGKALDAVGEITRTPSSGQRKTARRS